MSTVDIEYPDRSRARAARRRQSGAARRRISRLGDPVFRGVATACGIAVAVAMFGLAGVLVYDSWPAISGLGTEVLTTVAWSPTHRPVRRPRGAGRHVPLHPRRDGHRRAAGARHRPAAGGARAPGGGAASSARPSRCWPPSPASSSAWSASSSSCPSCRTTLVPWLLETPLGKLPGIKPGATVPGRRPLDPHRRRRARLHGAAVHHGGLARRAAHGAPGDQGGRLRHGLHHLGGHAQDQPALRQQRHRRAPCSSASAAPSARPWPWPSSSAASTRRCRIRSSTPARPSPRSSRNTFNEATDKIQVSALIELGLILFLITVVFQFVAQAWLRRVQPRHGRPGMSSVAG